MAEDRGSNRPNRDSRPAKPNTSRPSRRDDAPQGGGKPRNAAPRKPREGDRRENSSRDGVKREWKPRDDERRDRPARDDDRRPSERREYKPRDGERRPSERRDTDRRDRPRTDRPRTDRPAREGDRRPSERREYKPRDGEGRPSERREYKPRDRDNHRDRPARGGTRGEGRSDRGGVDREFTEAERLQHELRPVRSYHRDPELPEAITAKDLNPGARNELKTLDKDLADTVARHLAMVNILLESEPELAHQHAISASRKAGRIPVTRETLAITSYVLEDYAGALRELRTYRRLSGSENQLAMMIDCERALGRPEKALELGRSVARQTLPTDVQVQVAIALSGARLDLGQTDQALFELEIAQLDPSKAFSWSPELFGCYANVLEDLGRADDAALWRSRAEQAERALDAEFGEDDIIDVLEIAEVEPEPEPEHEAPNEGDLPPQILPPQSGEEAAQ